MRTEAGALGPAQGPAHAARTSNGVGWLAQHTDKTAISTLLRSSWQTVDGIITRVVGEALNSTRLAGLLRIGVDEVSLPQGPPVPDRGRRP